MLKQHQGYKLSASNIINWLGLKVGDTPKELFLMGKMMIIHWNWGVNLFSDLN
jgi:hypothetical protein